MPSNRVCTWPTPRTCTTRPPCLGGATQPPHLPWTFHLASLLLLLLFILWGLFILWFYAWKQLDQMLTRHEAYAGNHDKWMEAEERSKSMNDDLKLRGFLMRELEVVEARLGEGRVLGDENEEGREE
ncbi:hypothetical protein EKO04_002101 [Ascochyta lentis]|uniref:Uncharacterized protein n=1 Tax=Ascochyta lentis TaxID=205686 RepID=A0A8H7J7R1_9PLEO|nr:hypothetical protein EKO04_002101 [Ascochyta lentis]